MHKSDKTKHYMYITQIKKRKGETPLEAFHEKRNNG